MSHVLETISRIEELGGRLTVDGGRVRYRVPKGKPEVQPLLAELRNHREEVVNLLRQRELPWPPACLDAERRFGHSSARLYPYLGRQVRTPRGTGQLVQVFTDWATVLLNGADRLSSFTPEEIWPLRLM